MYFPPPVANIFRTVSVSALTTHCSIRMYTEVFGSDINESYRLEMFAFDGGGGSVWEVIAAEAIACRAMSSLTCSECRVMEDWTYVRACVGALLIPSLHDLSPT